MGSTITVSELIKKLTEMGDKNWRDSAVVKVRDMTSGYDIDVDPFDIKFGAGSLDIYVELLEPESDEDDDEDDDYFYEEV